MHLLHPFSIVITSKLAALAEKEGFVRAERGEGATRLIHNSNCPSCVVKVARAYVAKEKGTLNQRSFSFATLAEPRSGGERGI